MIFLIWMGFHVESELMVYEYVKILLDSGASISVLNYTTYVTIAKLLNLKQNKTLNPSTTLTVANQIEVPKLHYVIITFNTTIEGDSRHFTISLQ